MIPSRFSVFLFSTSFSDLPFILFVCFFSASYSIHNLHLVGIIIFTSLQGVMYVFMLAHFYQKKKNPMEKQLDGGNNKQFTFRSKTI